MPSPFEHAWLVLKGAPYPDYRVRDYRTDDEGRTWDITPTPKIGDPEWSGDGTYRYCSPNKLCTYWTYGQPCERCGRSFEDQQGWSGIQPD